MKILVCGSRFWKDIETIADVLSTFSPDTTVVHGACRGADFIAGEVSKQLGFTVRPYPANWNRFKVKHKNPAGIIRNQEMLDKEHRYDDPIILCIAFHDDLERSAGTKDMVERASRAAIPVRNVRSSDAETRQRDNR